jgi:glutamate-ammonia-ligase adenylyltransferase
VRTSSTTAALAELRRTGLLAEQAAGPLARGHRFLRRVESRLRIVRDRAISHLPTSGRELLLLARRLGYSGPRAGEELLADYERETQSVRAAFLRVLEAA